MKAKHVFNGVVNDEGEWVPNYPERYEEALALYKGREVKMGLEENTDLRIRSHRGYYRGVVVPHMVKAFISQGYDFIEGNADDTKSVHEWLVKEFCRNGYKKKNSAGVELSIPPSTSRLKDEGWKRMFREIELFAIDFLKYKIPPRVGKGYFPTEEK